MDTTARLTLETIEAGLRFRAEAGSGQAMVLDSGPGMQAPNPVEALVAALGACHGMDVIAILRKKRQQVTGYDIEVRAERGDEHPRALKRVAIVHRLRGHDLNPAAVQDALRLSTERYCSVHASLAKDIPIDNRFEISPP